MASQTLRFICAGHPPLFLCHADGQVEWLGQVANLPLGIDAAFVYQHEEYAFRPGDRLLLYSDGAYEAKNEAGHFFSLSQLATAFAETPLAPEAAIQTLRRVLADFTASTTLSDDTTFFCVRAWDNEPL